MPQAKRAPKFLSANTPNSHAKNHTQAIVTKMNGGSGPEHQRNFSPRYSSGGSQGDISGEYEGLSQTKVHTAD